MHKIKMLGSKYFVKPIVNLLVKMKIHPNLVTLLSLLLGIVAFLFYWQGIFWAGAIFLFLCGIFDTFDGEIARQTNRVTKIGGFLDSTADRINEFLIYLGLFLYYYSHETHALFWIFTAMFGSMMVSYTRARGEGLGISPQVGFFERFTRILLYVLVLLTLGTIQTMIQRIIYTHIKSAKN
jgi:CDP-diacylglycerol--glycerol-3-phosphate 3-phosphatidyltransferase